MNIWELVILIIVGSVCVFGGIGAVYGSIVKAIERYQINKENRSIQTFIKLMEIMPDVLSKIIDVMDNKIDESEKKAKERHEKFMKELEESITKDAN